MPLVLAGTLVSQPTRAVAFFLNNQGVKFDFKPVDLAKGENRTPEALKHNPLGTVPYIEDGEFVLAESTAIMAYVADSNDLEDMYPRKDLKRRALINQYWGWHHGNTRKCSGNIFRPLLMKALGKDMPASESAVESTMKVLEFINARLGEHAYIVDDKISVADFSLYCEVDQLVVTKSVDIAKDYPHLHAWMQGMSKLPGNEEGAKALEGFAKNVLKIE